MVYARIRVFLPPALAALLLAPRARACEGPCIVAVTNAFVGNYSVPVQHVFADVAASIARTLLPAHGDDGALATRLVEPLLAAYERGAHDAMQQAIFPGYFHGKCQVDGVDPAGCPNPDCPVVCGTPGSMVHFYRVLQEIAFNVTVTRLAALCAPTSTPYQTLETALLRELRTEAPHARRRSLRPAHGASRLAPHPQHPQTHPHPNARPPLQKRHAVSQAQAKAHLRSVCRGMVHSLAQECGGATALPRCSWPNRMKAFILSFP